MRTGGALPCSTWLRSPTMHRLDHAAESLLADNVFESKGLPFGDGRLLAWWSVVTIRVRPMLPTD